MLLSVSILAHANEPEIAKTYLFKNYGVKHARGLIRTGRSRDFLLSSPKQSFLSASASIPGKYSMRGKAGAVEDQGQCGSCWDFSLTSVLRGTWIMAGKDPGRLSFNYLLNCDTTMQGCNGGDFVAADLFVNPKGAPAYGSDGEYTAEDGTCTPEKAVASTVDYHLLGSDGTTDGVPTPSFKDIAYIVGVLHRPVSIDVAADDNWENYAGGIYNGCSDNVVADINHMVSIEGYSCEKSVDSKGNCVFDANGNLPNGQGLWVIRNSWGTSWGDGGYITTKATDSKGERCNAVANDALYYDIQ
jgi:cathepsin L